MLKIRLRDNKYLYFALLYSFIIFIGLWAVGVINFKPVPPQPKKVENYWLSAKEDVDRSVMDILQQDKEEEAKGEIHNKLISGSPYRKEIALTFDDGPHPIYTRALLKILDKYNVKATFFLVGKKARQYPQLAKLEFDDGQQLGNHTYNHVNMKNVSDEIAATEIKACGKTLKSITGIAPHIFRPPGGNYDSNVLNIADTLGYTTVLWTENAGDCGRIGKSSIKHRIFKNLGNGSIILMHDGIQDSMDLLPSMIDRLTGEGYSFVTVDELIKHKNEKLTKKINIFDWLSGKIGLTNNNSKEAEKPSEQILLKDKKKQSLLKFILTFWGLNNNKK